MKNLTNLRKGWDGSEAKKINILDHVHKSIWSRIGSMMD